jgi:hypothetical protein
VTTGAGISNTNQANNVDMQYRRFATNGTTQIDVTLLGWVEFTGNQPGTLSAFLSRAATIVEPEPPPPPAVYLGWGDESSAPMHNCPYCETPIPEATIVVVPEPATLALVSSLAACALRRRAAASLRHHTG